MPVGETVEDFVMDAIGETRASLGSDVVIFGSTRSLWPLAAAATLFLESCILQRFWPLSDE